MSSFVYNSSENEKNTASNSNQKLFLPKNVEDASSDYSIFGIFDNSNLPAATSLLGDLSHLKKPEKSTLRLILGHRVNIKPEEKKC